MPKNLPPYAGGVGRLHTLGLGARGNRHKVSSVLYQLIEGSERRLHMEVGSVTSQLQPTYPKAVEVFIYVKIVESAPMEVVGIP